VGNADLVAFLRSAAKPFQAMPLVEDGVVAKLTIPADELALCCASHSGEPGHVEGVRRLLARCGVPESALACGPQRPLSEDAADELVRRGAVPERIHNNCSGKHAGMLALAKHHGWAHEGYFSPDHPVQLRMLAEVERWTGVSAQEIRRGVDGCGVVCFGIPLRAMALAYASLARASANGHPGPRGVLEAMVGNPWMVAGTGRMGTRVMSAARGSLVVKSGAEGIYCGAERSGRLGFALKVEDGAKRATEAATVWVLEQLGLLSEEARGILSAGRRQAVRNTRGEEAAFLEVEADFERLEA
jgi:L-asparaginase II